MKLLRTIQLDPSDTFVFEQAAEPGEWAVSGAFVFWDSEPATLTGKARSAFRSGFLGIASCGRSTLVQIVEADEAARGAAVDMLARQLVRHFGAPGMEEARAAAAEEVAFAVSLCNQPADTLIAVHRTFEKGEIRESFRTLRPREKSSRYGPVLSFLDVKDEEEPAEKIDLTALGREKRK